MELEVDKVASEKEEENSVVELAEECQEVEEEIGGENPEPQMNADDAAVRSSVPPI